MSNLLAELLCIYAPLSLQFISDCQQLGNIPRHAPPGDILRRPIAFPVQSEVCIVQSFNQPVFAFETVLAPRLDGEWLVRVIGCATLPVGFFDFSLDGFG